MGASAATVVRNRRIGKKHPVSVCIATPKGVTQEVCCPETD